MAGDTKTPEEIIAELTAQNQALTAENTQLKADLEAKATELTSIKKVVEGTYTSKKHNKTVQMKPGHLFVNHKGIKYSTQDLISNDKGQFTAVLDELIAMEYGGFEVVKK